MSKLIALSHSLGNPTVDRALIGLLEMLEADYPNRIQGCYVTGSYADQTALATSDVDLDIILKGDFIDQDEQRAMEIRCETYRSTSPVDLDASVYSEKQMQAGAYPHFKYQNIFIYGEDRSQEIDVMPIADWTRERMHSAYWLIIHVFNRAERPQFPLPYPDPQGECLGYDNRTTAVSHGKRMVSTRNLIRVIGWAATALIAYQAKQYVKGKQDCHYQYRKLINDEWSDFIEDLYHYTHTQWNYGIPEEPSEKQRLVQFCQKALTFEHHFQKAYCRFVLEDLADTNQSNLVFTLKRLRDTLFYHNEVLVSLKILMAEGPPAIKKEAQETFHVLEDLQKNVLNLGEKDWSLPPGHINKSPCCE